MSTSGSPILHQGVWPLLKRRSLASFQSRHCKVYSQLSGRMWTHCGMHSNLPFHTSTRRRRKALHKSRSWVVHLFAGSSSHKSFAALERDGAVVFELDVCRSPTQNLYRDSDPLRALLLKVARLGRVSAVLGGPPCGTMSGLRHRPGGPRPARSVWT